MKEDKLLLEQYYDNLNRKLREIIEHGYKNAPRVKRTMDSLGLKPEDIKNTDDLEKMPIVTKDQLVKFQAEEPPFGGYFAVPPEETQKWCVSPGPIYEPIDDEQTLAQFYEAAARINMGPGDRVINTFSYHLLPLGHWMDDTVRHMGAIVIPTGTGNTEVQVKTMLDLKVTGYIGTARYLDTIIKKAEEMGYDFRRDFSLRFCFVMADVCPKSLMQSFIQDYGLQVREAYGTADVGPIACDCEYHSGFHLVKNIIIEIVDPVTKKRLPPGKIGEVVATSFDRSYVLIRFGTGDLSRFEDTPCPCGNPIPRLMGFLGRVGESIRVRGRFLSVEDVKRLLAQFPQLTKYQVAISFTGRRKDIATLNVEGDYNENISREIIDDFPKICGVKLDNVEFVSPGTIPADAKIIVDQRHWE